MMAEALCTGHSFVCVIVTMNYYTSLIFMLILNIHHCRFTLFIRLLILNIHMRILWPGDVVLADSEVVGAGEGGAGEGGEGEGGRRHSCNYS